MKPSEIRHIPIEMLEGIAKVRQDGGGKELREDFVKAMYDTATQSILAEIAAQFAEANEKLTILLDPPLKYETTKIDPNSSMGFSNDISRPLLTIMEPRSTLRDQFAMCALQGELSATRWAMRPEEMKAMVKQSYDLADLMMEARK